MTKRETTSFEEYIEIYTPFITIKGRRVFRKNGKMFRLLIPREKLRRA